MAGAGRANPRNLVDGLNRIEDKWGKTPLALWNDPRMVASVVGWRNSLRETPRAADIGVMVLSRLLEFGRLQALVTVNVAASIPTIYRGADRADIIWTQEDIDAFCRSALVLDQAHLIEALYLAAMTGMRRTDLAGLTWDEISDHAIVRIAEKKSRGKRRRAVIPILTETAAFLAELKTHPREKGVNTVLVNSYGRPWADGNSLGPSTTSATMPASPILSAARSPGPSICKSCAARSSPCSAGLG